MEYFCTKCQRKHSADRIGFDLWEICKERAAARAEELLGDQRQDLAEGVARWCRDPNNKSFVFVGGDLLNRIAAEPGRANQTIVSGRFSLPLSWLLDEYARANRLDVNSIRAYLDPEEYYQEVYSGYMKVTYVVVDEQRVLTRLQDENNDPFTIDGVKLGFRRCCPKGHLLSPAVGKAKEYVVALAGSPRAGKTSCLIAITRALRDKLYPGMSLDSFYDDPQWEKIVKEIGKYKEGLPPDKTGLTDRDLNYSILVKVGNAKRVLTFVDMPGELWQADGTGFSTQFYTDYAGIYENLDCIWFFISKWTAYGSAATNLMEDNLKKVEDLTAETKKQVEEGDAANLNANLSNLREQLNASGMPIPPIAVILTKGDVPITPEDWQHAKKFGLFPTADGALATPADVKGVNSQELQKLFLCAGSGKAALLDEHEYWLRSKWVREFFRTVNGSSLSEAIEENCEKRTYISMAAYGHYAPKEDSDLKPIPPTPYHEMLPLLWTFAILGALPVKHRCEWYRHPLLGKPELVRKEDLTVTFSNARYDYLRSGQAAAGGKGSQNPERDDRNCCVLDIGKNLLTIMDNRGNHNFSTTVIPHEKRW